MEKRDLIAEFGNISRCAEKIGMSRTTITNLPDGPLSENVLMHVRNHFLHSYRIVPEKWMPPMPHAPERAK